MGIRKAQVVVDLDAQRQNRAHQQVLERLFHEHHAELRAFLVSCMGVDESGELDDVIQEVFVRLARLDELPRRLPPDIRKTNASYLFSIAHNLVIDRQRKQIRRDRHLEKEAQSGSDEEIAEDSPESIILAQQELEKVKQVLLGMRPKWRQVFILSRFKFKTYPEIAREMGVSVKQVEQYMSRALQEVRRVLADFAPGAISGKGGKG